MTYDLKKLFKKNKDKDFEKRRDEFLKRNDKNVEELRCAFSGVLMISEDGETVKAGLRVVDMTDYFEKNKKEKNE